MRQHCNCGVLNGKVILINYRVWENTHSSVYDSTDSKTYCTCVEKQDSGLQVLPHYSPNSIIVELQSELIMRSLQSQVLQVIETAMLNSMMLYQYKDVPESHTGWC